MGFLVAAFLEWGIRERRGEKRKMKLKKNKNKQKTASLGTSLSNVSRNLVGVCMFEIKNLFLAKCWLRSPY